MLALLWAARALSERYRARRHGALTRLPRLETIIKLEKDKLFSPLYFCSAYYEYTPSQPKRRTDTRAEPLSPLASTHRFLPESSRPRDQGSEALCKT